MLAYNTLVSPAAACGSVSPQADFSYYLTIIRRRRSEYCRIIPESGDYSTIFTEPEENNCFSIIAQVIIRAIEFSFILFVFSSTTFV